MLKERDPLPVPRIKMLSGTDKLLFNLALVVVMLGIPLSVLLYASDKYYVKKTPHIARLVRVHASAFREGQATCADKLDYIAIDTLDGITNGSWKFVCRK